MKLWARTAAALLAAVMLLAACACGGTSTTSSQGNPSNPSAPASNPSTPASTQDVELIMDLGGYEFTWATIWSWANYPEPGATEYGDRRLESYEKIEKQYNCSDSNRQNKEQDEQKSQCQQLSTRSCIFKKFFHIH